MTGAIVSGTFESYVPGPTGRVALTAARAIAEAERPPYNPLLIVGTEGLGKSHLLHAIQERVSQVNPSRTILLIPARTIGEDDAALQSVQLLLVDDAQDLISSRSRQRTLADCLEARAEAGLATVVAIDRSPGEVRGCDPRLARILVSGLVTELDVPESQDRLRILQAHKAERPLGGEILETLALHAGGSVKELLASYQRLVAFQAVSREPLGLTQAQVLLLGHDPEAGARADALPDSVIVAGEAAPPPEQEVGATGRPDEFGDFLSEVVASVTNQVDRWRERVGEAILRWGGEGYRTVRLESLLTEEFPQDPESVLEGFQADIETLRALEAEAREIDPTKEGDPAFRNPDDVPAARQALARTRGTATRLPGPSEQYTLNTFLEGQASRAALHAAKRMLEEPTGVSPTVVVGASGTGKTHFLHAVGNLLKSRGAEVVVCVSGYEVAALEPGQLEAVRHATALLLDDFDHLAGHPRHQAALLRAVDALLQTDAVIVCSSSRPLQELSDIDARLLSRLGAGLLIELEAPDRELRLRLLKRLIHADQADAAAFDALADRVVASIRDLQGMVHRVVNEAARRNVPLSAAVIREVLDAPASKPAAARPKGSGLVNPILAGARMKEKVVDRWPDVEDRLLEELQ